MQSLANVNLFAFIYPAISISIIRTYINSLSVMLCIKRKKRHALFFCNILYLWIRQTRKVKNSMA